MNAKPINELVYFENPDTHEIVECSDDPKEIAALLNQGFHQVPAPGTAGQPEEPSHGR